MNVTPASDPGCVWAYGKIEPGWYCARWPWSEKYAEHLKSLGYKVMRSVNKPTVDPSEV